MKRTLKYILGLCLVIMFVVAGTPETAEAASGSISMSVSASSVNIGDKITVTLTGSADAEALIQISVSCSSGAIKYVGQGNASAILEPTAGESKSATLEYEAVSPGTVTVTASVVQAYDVMTQEAISIGSASQTITVNNAASNDGGNAGGGNSSDSGSTGSSNSGDSTDNTTTTKSADNSLKSLTISPGTLSPKFKYSTTNYTATVGADVTSVAVDAQVSNSKATVESVTGNNNLQMGENTIKIVVKAENGTIATYKIVVTRSGAAEEPQEPEDTPEETPQEIVDTGIQINGKAYKVSAKLPEDELPEEFAKTTMMYGEQEVEAYAFPYADLKLLCLTAITEDWEAESEENQGKFFFYNGAANEFFPYINVTVGQKYVLMLPNSFADVIPEGYQETTVAIGELSVNGYQIPPAEGDATGEFYLVYCVDQTGVAGWYQYDSIDMSLQRFHETTVVVTEDVSDDEARYQKAYELLQKEYEEEMNSARMIMAILVFLLVVAIIVIINILVFTSKGRGRKSKNKNDDLDYIDFDDL